MTRDTIKVLEMQSKKFDDVKLIKVFTVRSYLYRKVSVKRSYLVWI